MLLNLFTDYRYFKHFPKLIKGVKTTVYSVSVNTISIYEHEKLVECYLMIWFCAYQLDIENRKYQINPSNELKIIKSNCAVHL